MYTHLNLTNRLTTCGFTPPENHKLEVPPYRKCKLYDYNQDTSKTWSIEFYQWNIQTQRKQRRFFSKFNSIQNPKKRLDEAKRWIAFIDQQLEQGAVYNPNATIPAPKPVEQIPLLTADLKAYLSDKESTLGEDSYKVYRNFGDKLTAFVKENKLQGLATKDLTPEWCSRYRQHILKLHDHPTTRNKELECVDNHSKLSE
ncbi:hypothetical protein CLV58_111178 [Spirosoma oryzae]|uniref:Uncharacterized protein n=1 Tax=Spirosoma oryzae TaxID=1469603 RepID=A0A2T0SUP9_9BACT|nr:phage integrase SAM-like domain-containing protein [Spirosoma oryzae]PRY37139.1 hypothetical protein CLV58_111178 [Spirosoma oryzae]